jgi:hypothetical protein
MEYLALAVVGPILMALASAIFHALDDDRR